MKNPFVLHALVFCYIFSFYVLVFPASMIIALPLFVCVCASRRYLCVFLRIWGNRYIYMSFISLIFINFFALFFTLMYGVFDLSLGTILMTQIVHFVCAVFFFTFLEVKEVAFNDVCHAFVNVFIIQTFIQIAGFLNPGTVGKILRVFNHYDPESVIGIGDRARGFALSAATTYHLSLVYGVAFIVFIKELVDLPKVRIRHLVRGLLIVIGIFFAGRTGFVGVAIGSAYFLLVPSIDIKKKLLTTCKLFMAIALMIIAFFSFLPKSSRDLVFDYLIPYAFEFVYSKFDSGKAQTASTNQLQEMWRTEFDDREIVLGSGKYTEENGRYYMHVDPGVLRHLLYGGIVFYTALLLYQMEISFPLVKKKKDYYMFVLIFIYFVLMDFKGVTVAVNKFAFSTSLMLGYVYQREITA